MFESFSSPLPEPGEIVARDPLTGMQIRSQLVEQLYETTAISLEQGQPFSLIMIDLDHFKSVNDAFGYTTGDQVLVEFTQRLNQLVSHENQIYRYGGDEFIILLPKTGKSQAGELARGLLEQIEASTFSKEPAIKLSVSIGVATCPEDGLTPDALFEAADAHHYEAKRSGRSRVIQAMPEWQAPAPVIETPLLIERGEEIRRIDDFINQLPLNRRGMCKIHGPAGAGKTRLMTEAIKLARLLGYQAITLSGTPARRTRLFGALQDGARLFEDLPDPLAGEAGFLEALDLALFKRSAAGLIVLVDDYRAIDPATLAFVQSWSEHLRVAPLAFIVAVPERPDFSFSPDQGMAETNLRLSPLSLQGLATWLVNSFGNPPPEDFLSWLHAQTQGWPGQIQAGLTYLYEQDFIQFQNETWRITPEAMDMPLSTWLGSRHQQPRRSLPPPPNELVGRQDEIETLKQQIAAHPLVLISGSGGIGKTRLAQQVGLEMLEQFADGVFFVPLDLQPGKNNPITAMADALQLRFYGTEAMDDQLVRYLKHKDLLLVLDNPIALDSLVELLLHIFTAAPSVKVLVTAREKISFAGGAILELNGLPYHQATEVLPALSPAERFFLYSAQRIQPDFKFADADRLALAHICRLLDGMPLAIELAASSIASYSLPEIKLEIEKSLGFLTTERRDVQERHRSLLAVFDYFWNMLSSGEQEILSRLSIFQHGFTAAAAQQIAEAAPFFLDALCGRAYLHKTAPDYYEMHALLRRYSLEKLEENPALYRDTRQLHCRYYMDSLHHHREAYARGTIPQDNCTRERENYRLGWSWALENNLVEPLSSGLEGYYAFLHLTGNFKEGELVFRQALAGIDERVNQPGAYSSAQQLLQCRLNLRLAGFLNKLGLFEEAVDHAQKAAQAAHRQGDRDSLAASLLEWGDGLRHQGDFPAARKRLLKALALARQHHQPVLIIDCLYALGAVSHYLSNLAEQYRYAEEALQLSLENEDLRGQSRAYNLLAIATEMEGKYSLAKAYYERSIQIAQQTGDRRSESIPLINLASLLQLLGNYPAARSAYEQFLAIKQDLSDRPGEVWALVYLSLLFHQLGNQPVAENYARQGLASAIEIGDRQNQATALTNLGHALAAQQQVDRAADAYRQALTLRKELGQETMSMEPLAGLARSALANGNRRDALSYIEPILAYLEQKSLDGNDEPFRVWLTCYQVLEAAQDPRSADILERAYQLLLSRGGQIQDEDLRRSFVENVDAHQSLVGAWQAYSASR
jgi:diguanylate cyclase (GGDEF)-like protein